MGAPTQARGPVVVETDDVKPLRTLAFGWARRRRLRRERERERFAVRVANILGRQGLSFGDVKNWDDDRLLAIPDIGPKAVALIRNIAATGPREPA